MFRADSPWLLAAARASDDPPEPTVGATAEMLEVLRARGASFATELRPQPDACPRTSSGRCGTASRAACSSCDGFGAIRALIGVRHGPDDLPSARASPGSGGGASSAAGAAGRWSLVPPVEPDLDRHDLAEAVAEQLLNRWGVLFRDLAARDGLRLPWREIQWALRRLEDRGLVRGGRFVTGFSGEQYALPEAAEQLARGSPDAQNPGARGRQRYRPTQSGRADRARGNRCGGADQPGRVSGRPTR